MILFICGIPASGKSSFGKFLKDKHGFYYVDMENSPWPDEGIHNVWNLIFTFPGEDKRVLNFINELKQKSAMVVLDLGFPIHDNYFKIVPSLKSFGCWIVWFECDENIARERYTKRDSRPIEWFNTQMTNIKNGWETIEDKIDPIKINVLKADKSGKTEEELYSELVKLRVINNV